MTLPISEITVFHNDGGIQKLTGTYEIHDTYIHVQMQDEHKSRLWHNIVIPMHAIEGFEAHERPQRLYTMGI